MNGGEKQVPTPPLSSGKSLANSAADPVPATAVRDQLARVVNSPGFVSSARLCRFLTHIVNRTIDRNIDSLKGFSIAMEVFDRTSEYDPNIDAIVRVEQRHAWICTKQRRVITTFDALGARSGSGHGTSPDGINDEKQITGMYVDSNNATHGFLRIP